MRNQTMRNQAPKQTTTDRRNARKPLALRTHLRAGAFERENNTQE